MQSGMVPHDPGSERGVPEGTEHWQGVNSFTCYVSLWIKCTEVVEPGALLCIRTPCTNVLCLIKRRSMTDLFTVLNLSLIHI